MDFLTLCAERYSVRSDLPDPVPAEALAEILRAGQLAPTAKNNQKPVMVAVRDKETRDLLSRINAEIWGTESDPFYGAPCVIVVLADPDIPTWIDDGSLASGSTFFAMLISSYSKASTVIFRISLIALV